jgi:tetratricopeptide (TPR) repeat protein
MTSELAWGRVAACLFAVLAGAVLAADAGAQPQQRFEATPGGDVYYERGARALRQGDLATAIDYLARAAEASPGDASVLATYAQALIAAGREDEAAAILERVGGGQSRVGDDLALGVVRYQLHQYEQAADHLRRATASDPSNPAAHLYLASALIELGEYDEAASHLADARRLNPDLGAEVEFRLGRLELARGNRSSAQRHFEEVQRLAPGTSLARAAQQMIGGRADSQRPWSFYATLGAAYDSNVNLAGVDETLSTDREDDYRGFAEVGADWEVFDSDLFNWRVGGTAYINRHVDQRDFDLLTGRAWTVGAFNLSEQFTVDGRYTYEQIWTNFRNFRRTHAVEPSLRWRPADPFQTRLFFRYEDRSFERDTLAFPLFAIPPEFVPGVPDDPLDRDGQLYGPGVEQYWFFPDFTGWGRGFLRLGYRHRIEQTEGTESDSRAHIANVMVGMPLLWQLYILAEGEYEWRNHSHVSVLGLVSGDEFGYRQDEIRQARVALRRPITDQVSAELGYRWMKWGSNVDFYEFSRHIVHFLVTYRY